MSIVTCPTDIVEAPASVVWDMLTTPAELARWTGSRLVEGPGHSGALRAGDRLVLGAGWAGLFRVTLDVLEAESPRQFAVDVQLPFGIINHEVVVVMTISPASCRVTLN